MCIRHQCWYLVHLEGHSRQCDVGKGDRRGTTNPLLAVRYLWVTYLCFAERMSISTQFGPPKVTRLAQLFCDIAAATSPIGKIDFAFTFAASIGTWDRT